VIKKQISFDPPLVKGEVKEFLSGKKGGKCVPLFCKEGLGEIYFG